MLNKRDQLIDEFRRIYSQCCFGLSLTPLLELSAVSWPETGFYSFTHRGHRSGNQHNDRGRPVHQFMNARRRLIVIIPIPNAWTLIVCLPILLNRKKSEDSTAQKFKFYCAGFRTNV